MREYITGPLGFIVDSKHSYYSVVPNTRIPKVSYFLVALQETLPNVKILTLKNILPSNIDVVISVGTALHVVETKCVQ